MRPQIGHFLQYLSVERVLRRTRSRATARICTRWPNTCPMAMVTRPPPGSITTNELRGFLSALHEAGYAKTSISRRMASVRSFIRSASAKAGPNRTRPRHSQSRKSRKLPHFLTTRRSRQAARRPKGNTPAAVRDRAILETLYSAGLRVSELVGVTDGDLDFAAGIVRIRGKGKKERLAPIGSYAARASKGGWKSARYRPRKEQAEKHRSSPISSAPD